MSGPGLDTYRRKRDFTKTAEPRGAARARRGRRRPRFVVHEHAARTHHYDFRLEVNRLLKSWAVPKGPSTDPRLKRLATPTEDHPLEYLAFEGTIPPGEYGAGAVIVWDTGPYRNLTGTNGDVPMEAGLARGHVRVFLEGRKLRGAWALTRLKAQDDWLLVKVRDQDADARRDPVHTEPWSVKSGRTVRDLAAEPSP